jgi:hypothetical protein
MGPRKKMISDIYHGNQGEKRNLMGYVENKGVEEGGWVHKKKGLRNDMYHDH